VRKAGHRRVTEKEENAVTTSAGGICLSPSQQLLTAALFSIITIDFCNYCGVFFLLCCCVACCGHLLFQRQKRQKRNQQRTAKSSLSAPLSFSLLIFLIFLFLYCCFELCCGRRAGKKGGFASLHLKEIAEEGFSVLCSPACEGLPAHCAISTFLISPSRCFSFFLL
jgi:hypothetical protein